MSFFLSQLNSKAELELKEENEDDYAMNSECYLEVSVVTDDCTSLCMLYVADKKMKFQIAALTRFLTL